jgi:amidohydrolase
MMNSGSDGVSLRRFFRMLVFVAATAASSGAISIELRDSVLRRIDAEFPALEAIYRDLHAHPELSFMEIRTAAFLAKKLRALGFEVTEKVGNTGVVGVFKNGSGPTVLVRGDMDGLPIKEATGLPFASTDIVKDLAGRDQPAMHGCAHDVHVTTLIGTARVLMSIKDRWSGTLVIIGQPAEEIGAGARAMLSDGLYTRFPKPDYALALHAWSQLPAGEIGYGEGPFMANVNSVDILVRGVGGHGSAPHTTKDPIVLASQIVLGLQTIVSREVKPGTTAVVTIGSIHGGFKRNIISDEVKLELTLRTFDETIMTQLIASIRRISKGIAEAAGVPEDRLPVVSVTQESTPATVNDGPLTRRMAAAFQQWLPPERVKPAQPTTGGEDFSQYGRTKDKVGIMLWWVGATAPEKFAESSRTGVPVPSNHAPTFAPVAEITIKTCVTSMTAAVLELLGETN